MCLALLFLATAVCALAQLDNDTILVTAQAVNAPQPDSVWVDVCLAAQGGTSLDAVLAPLSGLGIHEQNLLGVADYPEGNCAYPEPSEKVYFWWRFGYAAPVAKVKETVAALRGIRAGLPADWLVTYSLQGQWSGGQECAIPTLVSQARRHAENIAAAMAARVGPIVALSNDLSVLFS